MRTLVIASVASATAAVVTSQLSTTGTWIAAAMTPVIVTLVSELLHRPTERIAGRISTERPAPSPRPGAAARRREEPVEEATSAAGPPPARPEQAGRPPARPQPASGVRVYRSSATPPRRRKVAVGAVLGTAMLALLIAVVALTVPELVAGGSVGESNRSTTFFGKRNSDSSDAKDQRAPTTDTTDDAPTETEQTPTSEQPTSEEPPPEQTTTTPPVEPPPEETTTTPPPTEP